MIREYRKIIHVDMDAFFASIEQRDNPQLRGKPVAVGHAGDRGVVAAASYEARRFGVHSAMPSTRAKQLCPSLIFVHSRMQHYKNISEQIQDIFHRYTDIIEPISIDEAFLDVTHNKVNASLGLDVAICIKRDIYKELGLIASAGVSYNKFLAKIASDYRKPNGLCVIHPNQAIDFIDRLPIEAFWGIGPATAKKLHAMGIKTAPELRQLSLSRLIELFGKAGVTYYRFVRGIDDREVLPYRERKSIGCEKTFLHDLQSHELDRALDEVIDELISRVKGKNFLGKRLTLKVRFHDFKTVTRSFSQAQYLNEYRTVKPIAKFLLNSIPTSTQGIRLLGLSVSKTELEIRRKMLSPQLSLF